MHEQVKNVERARELTLTEQTYLLHHMGLGRDGRDQHPHRQHSQPPQRKSVQPLQHGVAASAHAAQTQARPFACAGIWASRSALKVACVHQQGGCFWPLLRSSAMAQWLAFPHRGQCSGLGGGLVVMAKFLWRGEGQAKV